MNIVNIYESRDEAQRLILAIFCETHVITAVCTKSRADKINSEQTLIRLHAAESLAEIMKILRNVGFSQIKYKIIKENKEKPIDI